VAAILERYEDLFQQSVPWKPHGYQKKAVRFLLEHACGALFLDPASARRRHPGGDQAARQEKDRQPRLIIRPCASAQRLAQRDQEVGGLHRAQVRVAPRAEEGRSAP